MRDESETDSDGYLEVESLAFMLDRLVARGAGYFLIVAVKGDENIYVQFSAGEGLWAEAVSNEFLLHRQLTEGEHALMLELGWNPPGADSPNYHRAWDGSVPIGTVALLATRTLAEVYSAAEGTSVTLELFRG